MARKTETQKNQKQNKKSTKKQQHLDDIFGEEKKKLLTRGKGMKIF